MESLSHRTIGTANLMMTSRKLDLTQLDPRLLKDRSDLAPAPASVQADAEPPLAQALGGLYCETCDVARPQAQSEGHPGHGVAAWAIDPDSAHALWTESEALCELTFLTE